MFGQAQQGHSLDKIKEFNQAPEDNLDLEDELTDEEDISEDVQKDKFQKHIEKGMLQDETSGEDNIGCDLIGLI